ncbi:zinc metalloproteinase-disintegrin-like brevilysin H2a isoform X2 [Gouania willdenowi]|uniref:zinc metalloproteinase-disintegrin-like brevilysin H2a isoform X2 n=1 Tax=Gouania willdenowi TaxID=441366 RepID=UPI001055235F|nr:zinc metalloproteinase-disintegrin-like brevilysin H2a isoform X2 [Gouania willdenowi]
MRTGTSVWLSRAFFVVAMATLPHAELYEVIRPHRWGRSPQDGQVYPDTVDYELTIEGRIHTIHLQKNSELLGRGFTETFYSHNGERQVATPLNQDHCFYQGQVVGMASSWVSMALCSGLRGSLWTGSQLYLIEPLGRTDLDDHALYRQEHMTSSSTNDSVLLDQDRGPRLAGLFKSRSWKSKGVLGAPLFVELFVVVDHSEYQRYGADTKSRVLGAVNHVDQLYRPLNIRVVLVGLEMWSKEDLIHVDMDSETTLDHFLLWRQTDLLKRSRHDNAQLVTGRDFDGDTVGLANKFAMCTENSGGVNQDHHANVLGLASTIAHEMGHNFGLSHDGSGCVCGPSYSSGNCVMADRLRTGNQVFPEFFSGCSVDQLREFLARAQPVCLDPPVTIRSVGVERRCGNALIDPGEECDCGSVEECTNSCCDAATCRLSTGSQCAHGQCCENCQLRAPGSVCRESVGDCDLPEFCSGTSAQCPVDNYHMNGRPCYNQDPGFCYQGRCPTHRHHCWRLFGPGSSVASDRCFDLNKRGEAGANCGRNGRVFASCSTANVKCGSIFCGGGGEESITGKRALYTLFGAECKLAVDNDKTRNLDMVPEGATCGPEQVCFQHRCVHVSIYGRSDDCAKKCNNHGVCNHKEECQCDAGWAPPLCHTQYNQSQRGQAGMIVGVCASLSLLLLVGVLMGLICWKKVDRSKAQRTAPPTVKVKLTCASSVRQRPDISSPTFMTSTATQACRPLMAREAPQLFHQ